MVCWPSTITNIWGTVMTTRKTTSTTKKSTTRSSTSRAQTTKSASSVRSAPKVAPAKAELDDAVAPPVTAETDIPTEAAVETETAAEETNKVMRKGEFVDLVVAQTNMKKRDVRAMAAVMFKIMGAALAEGRTVAPDGGFKMRPVRQNPYDSGVVVTTRIRVVNPSPATTDAEAEIPSERTASGAAESPVESPADAPLAEPAE